MEDLNIVKNIEVKQSLVLDSKDNSNKSQDFV